MHLMEGPRRPAHGEYEKNGNEKKKKGESTRSGGSNVASVRPSDSFRSITLSVGPVLSLLLRVPHVQTRTVKVGRGGRRKS